MRRHKFLILILILSLSLLSACAMFQTAESLTAKQQAAVWMTIYNQTYDDTLAMAKNPNSTPAQKEMVAKKKAILMKVWPLLKSYIAITDSGGTPTNSQGAAITDLINQLTQVAGGAL